MRNIFDGYVIVSDLDGTLLNNDKNISQENLEAINYFTENGGTFSVATGRVIEATQEYLSNIKVNLPIIVYNGGVIYDYNNQKILSEKFVDDNQKQIVLKIKKEYDNIGIEIYANKKLYILKNSGHSYRSATQMLDILYDIKEDIFLMDWHKILIVGNIEVIDDIERTFEDKYKIKGTRSGRTSYELLPVNESKGQALKNIIKMYNLEPNKVICVGDNMNDLELLKEAAISFCPSNGSEQLKKYTDFIAPSNEEHVIKHIVNWLEKNLV
ncbi:putative phosphatase [Clostridium puniceum]|uniref:Putative phosphatase n=1 Tax=Clostridium puniceum TaxID=29367 RepID=A0A1S8TTX2_9CLOT|nr:HAD family hydrolase [Clostridium puniceum]OOM81174.1 putative phosphatase [Clostridium puniceum]